jgi:hypothetical protein
MRAAVATATAWHRGRRVLYARTDLDRASAARRQPGPSDGELTDVAPARSRAHGLALRLRTIRKQHQAGINPTTGELFDLFDLGERLDTEAEISEPAVPCSIAACKRASSAVVQSRPYCDRCAEALRAVTNQIASGRAGARAAAHRSDGRGPRRVAGESSRRCVADASSGR